MDKQPPLLHFTTLPWLRFLLWLAGVFPAIGLFGQRFVRLLHRFRNKVQNRQNFTIAVRAGGGYDAWRFTI